MPFAPPHATTSPAAARQALRLRCRRDVELLKHYTGNVPARLYDNFPASIGLAVEMANDRSPWLGAWVAAVLLLSALRLIGNTVARPWQQRARARPREVRRARRLQEGGLLLAGAMWGVLAWFGLPAQDVEGQYTMTIVLSAMAGGATGVLAPLRWVGALYIVEVLLPACVQLVLLPNPHYMLGSLGVVFLGVMLVGHRNNHRLLLRSLELQERNLDLVTHLQVKNAEVQAMNLRLEDRVAQRTADLREMAHRDALTGLFNRRGIVQGLDRLLERQAGAPASARRTTLAVLFLDLDRFKQINDGIGHDVGDLVLAEIARRFAACIPAGAVFGRWGGDEFIVVIGGEGDVAARAEHTAAELQLCLDRPIEIRGERLNLGVSIGLALYPDQAPSTAELIRAADLAAAEAKRQGRDRLVQFHHAMSATQRRRLELNLALRSATRDGSLRLVYQPIVDAQTGRVIALEGLLRWNAPGIGAVTPDEFIPIAEESDRIVEIGVWVLRRACADAIGWSGSPAPKVAVNVSVRQLLRSDFVLVVAEALRTTGLPAQRLTLEVTESVFAEQNSAPALQALLQLHAMGVQIDVDDFGTGYSSLSRLREFPLDAVKIDRSFVQVLDGPSCAIIEGTILMARRFGLLVIAEGVETQAQAAHLLSMGVDAFQGYLLGRPQDAPLIGPLVPVWRASARPRELDAPPTVY
jgi:diguanylate cyclase (GGDEF)-like protein